MDRHRIVLPAALVLMAGPSLARLQLPAQRTPLDARLVRDLDTELANAESSFPDDFVSIGAMTYFTARTASTGRELFRTNGTPGGAELVIDLNPGPADSDPGQLTAYGNSLVFTADDGTGRGVWITDGTPQGTVRLPTAIPTPEPMLAALNVVFFVTMDDFNAPTLWRTDGTAVGTYVVAAFGQTGLPPAELTQVGSLVFFRGGDITVGEELMRTDGTPSGTFLVADINSDNDPSSPGSYPADLVEFGGQLYFSARPSSNTTDRFLFNSDGTVTGTHAVTTAALGPQELTPFGPELLFRTSAALWKTNGTAAGTSIIDSVPAQGLTPSGARVFFTVWQPGTTGQELWAYDPAAVPPVGLVRDIWPGVGDGAPLELTDSFGTLLFTATEPGHGRELYRSDGTAAGTVRVTDLAPGPADGTFVHLHTRPDGVVLFAGGDGGPAGVELWRTDGTTAGTALLDDLDPIATTADGEPRFFHEFGGRTVFLSRLDTAQTVGLWISDGTPGGTSLLFDGFERRAGQIVDPQFVEWNGTLYFVGHGPGVERALWATDGTPAGTQLVYDPWPVTGFDAPIWNLFVHSGSLWFRTGGQLYRSDGTAAGTAPVDLGVSVGGPPVLFQGRYWFAGFETSFGSELYSSDLTPAGTQLVVDIAPGAASSTPRELVVSGGRLFFLADDGVSGTEPWVSDGTAQGTHLLADIHPGTAQGVFELTAFDGGVVFRADDGIHGAEPWRTDGTSAGTSLLADIAPGPSSSSAAEFTPARDRLFFRANDGVHGFELWQTDGTAAGTSMAADIAPGSGSGFPLGLAYQTRWGWLWFAADDGQSGKELWWLLPGSTPRLLRDHAVDFDPLEITPIGDGLWLSGVDPIAGREVMRVP